jgi:hypothetical protein
MLACDEFCPSRVQEWAKDDFVFGNYQGMDLLAELQRGMERIEKWGKQIDM